MGHLESKKPYLFSECTVEGYEGGFGENCRAAAELDNSVPGGQEGEFGDVRNRIKAACIDARETAMKTSRWNGELLKFLADNATNWDLEVIPAEFQDWIAQEKDMEAAQKAGKWFDLKMLM
jgi:hypothetical protein